MRPKLRLSVTVALLAGALFCGGCGREEGPAGGGDARSIVVGSKIDTEGALLGQMIVLALRDSGLKVTDSTHFGPTQVVRKALLSGEIDVYPEYTGNGAFFFDMAEDRVWHDARRGYETVRDLDAERNDVVWLAPAPANNTWAIAVPQDLAEAEGLRTLADLADYVNAGGELKLACSEEFVTSPMALPALQETYGFELKDGQLLTLASGNTAQTERAAAIGADGVNAAMAYGTDGGIEALGLTVLEDPRGAQPVYQPAPTVRAEVLREHPEIEQTLDPVFRSLDLQTLQGLNAEIAMEGRPAADVARDYLWRQGFLGGPPSEREGR